MDTLKKYAGPLLMLAIFETVTITLWLALYVRKHKQPGGWCSSAWRAWITAPREQLDFE